MDDGEVAVCTRGLLQPMAAVLDSVRTLRSLLASRCLLDADAEHLLGVAERHGEFVAATLGDLAALAPPELAAVLDELEVDLRTRMAAESGPLKPGRPAHPVGWQTAVAMLRAGLTREVVIDGLRRELDLTHAEAASAVEYGRHWLEEARRQPNAPL